MEIKVFGSGCASCKKLHALAQDAIKELNIEASIIYVTELEEIMKAGIMRTPALMINEKVKVMGRVPSMKELKQIISDEH